MGMSLSQLLQGIEVVETFGDRQVEVAQLCYDSRQVNAGSLFFALPGQAVDGHDYIVAAVNQGAAAVVMQRPVALPERCAGIVVADARLAMALMAKNFYGDPTRDMTLVGITGTNGKTTVSYLVEAIMRQAGLRPAVVGTVAYRFENERLEAPHTTPESVDLYRVLARFRKAGCNAVAMEVSSHALEQNRVAGLLFAAKVLTNLTPEHLDYHRDMENYFAAKRRLFRGPGKAVINIDDPFGIRLARELGDTITISALQQAVVCTTEVSLNLDGIDAELQLAGATARLRSPLLGQFNLQNLLCAAGVGVALGMTAEAITTGLENADRVPGRLEAVSNPFGCRMLVDYAHTADALEKALQALVSLKPTRLLTIFGCGGDRDKTKRPAMGKVATNLADLTIVTSDNPRTEEPAAIIDDIRPGVQERYPQPLTRAEAAAGASGYLEIEDRRAAIEFAVSLLQPGNLLLVAGKGHEDYQIIGKNRIHFDDREELQRAVALRAQTV